MQNQKLKKGKETYRMKRKENGNGKMTYDLRNRTKNEK